MVSYKVIFTSGWSGFDKTLALVAKFIIIRCIVVLGAAINWDIYQINVKMAFMNGISEVKIYMGQLDGCVQEEKISYLQTRKNYIHVFKGAKRIIHYTLNNHIGKLCNPIEVAQIGAREEI